MNILICDHYSQASIALLKSEPSLVVSQCERLQPLAGSDELHHCHALLSRSRTRIDAELIGSAPNLRLIVTATSGFDHIDLDLCRKKNIAVSYTPEANSQSAAEHTLLLALTLIKNFKMATQLIQENKWKDSLSSGYEIYSKTWGIIGAGRVGSRVAGFAKAFGAHVQIYDPYIEKNPEFSFCGLSELLRSSDIISIHTPLNQETFQMINYKTLDLVNDAFFINTSRGDVVEENALIKALEEKRLLGAALDVFHKEPLPFDSALRSFPNVVLSPHMGAKTVEAVEKASLHAAEETLRFLRGMPLHFSLL